MAGGDTFIEGSELLDGIIVYIFFLAVVVNFVAEANFYGEEGVAEVFDHFSFFIFNEGDMVMFDITGFVCVVKNFGNFILEVRVVVVFETEEPVFAVAEVVVPIFFGKKFGHEVAVEFVAGSG